MIKLLQQHCWESGDLNWDPLNARWGALKPFNNLLFQLSGRNALFTRTDVVVFLALTMKKTAEKRIVKTPILNLFSPWLTIKMKRKERNNEVLFRHVLWFWVKGQRSNRMLGSGALNDYVLPTIKPQENSLAADKQLWKPPLVAADRFLINTNCAAAMTGGVVPISRSLWGILGVERCAYSILSSHTTLPPTTRWPLHSVNQTQGMWGMQGSSLETPVQTNNAGQRLLCRAALGRLQYTFQLRGWQRNKK